MYVRIWELLRPTLRLTNALFLLLLHIIIIQFSSVKIFIPGAEVTRKRLGSAGRCHSSQIRFQLLPKRVQWQATVTYGSWQTVPDSGSVERKAPLTNWGLHCWQLDASSWCRPQPRATRNLFCGNTLVQIRLSNTVDRAVFKVVYGMRPPKCSPQKISTSFGKFSTLSVIIWSGSIAFSFHLKRSATLEKCWKGVCGRAGLRPGPGWELTTLPQTL